MPDFSYYKRIAGEKAKARPSFKLVRYSIFDIRIRTIVLSKFKRLWTFFLGKKLEHF